MAALAVLLFLVWWTMFSGRRGGDPVVDEPQEEEVGPEDGGPEGGVSASEDGDDRGGHTKLKG